MTHKLSTPDQWLVLYGDILYRYGIARVREVGIAEDLVQETFLTALKAKESYSGKASEQTWLIAILKHKILDYFRKTSREKAKQFDEHLAGDADNNYFDQEGNWKNNIPSSSWPDKSLEQEQFLSILLECIDRLPARMAQLFILREIDGMKSEQICELASISTMNNFWVILSRARGQLRHCLNKNWLNQ